jgi:hypothetical protein
VDDVFYFGGGTDTRWARNLATNKAVTLHIGDVTEAIIVEGEVDSYVPGGELAARMRADSATKYGTVSDPPEGASEPVFRLQPHAVLAWTNFPRDATRWRWPKP